MSENILVTGYAGYIGSHICKELTKQGYNAIGVDTHTVNDDVFRKYTKFRYTWDFGDDMFVDILKKHNITKVIHTAATSLVGPSIKDPDSYYTNNVDKMHNFLNSCRQAGVQRIVYSSSAATYGDGHEIFSESIVPNPISPYGRTKLIGEYLIEDYCTAYNMSGVGLRYFNVCGADPEVEFGQRSKPSHIISVAMTRAINGESMTLNGENFPTQDGTCERDYIHVVDVAKANVLALKAELNGFVAVNIGSGLGYSNRQIVDSINEFTDYKLDYNFGPARPGDPARLVCDNKLAKRTLNWVPEYSNLQTIIKTAEKWHEKLQG